MNAPSLLRSIWIKRFRLGPMDPVGEAELVEGRGLVGNANQGGRRQVTLLEEEVWDALTRSLGCALDPSQRRANLLVRDLPLVGTRGRVLRLGESRIRIVGETKPCERMEALCPGLEAALWPEWRGGAYGEVLRGGRVTVGDTVGWE
jgi:MOSC domain-containing protein YiiM